MIHKSVELILENAYADAMQRGHEFLTIEHVMLSLAQSLEGGDVLAHCGVEVHLFIEQLEEHIETAQPHINLQQAPLQSLSLQRLIENALMHIRSAEKKELEAGDLIISLFHEENSFTLYLLHSFGVERIDVLNYVSHGISKDDDYFSPRHQQTDHDALTQEDIDELLGAIGKGSTDDPQNRQTKANTSSVENPNVEKKERELLERYLEDMLELAKNNAYDILIGREGELKRTIEILCCRVKNNPLHVGEPGVGKTALVQGLAQKMAQGDIPKKLQNLRLFRLDFTAVLAGTKYRGEFEDRLQKILKILSKASNTIVYIDEIHNIVGAGSVSGSSLDAANILKPYLNTGKIRFIGSTTHEEFKKHFQKDRALSRRFQKVDIEEPTRDEAIAVVKGILPLFEDFHEVVYSDKVVKTAVDLSIKHILGRYLPDKAIEVIDEAGASVNLYHPNRRFISVKDIEKTVSSISKVPVVSVDANESLSLIQLQDKLSQRVFGQEPAITSIVNAVKRHRAGLGHLQKPIGSFLFIGPTGVGKTELCKALADSLSVPLIRFDMSEYMEKHSIARFLGAPPGYVGYDEGAQLTDKINKHPHAVLLLDEIEKAHPDIFNALLQVMDNATITDNTGRSADFRNVILIMTSNAGSIESNFSQIGFDEAGKFHYRDPKEALKNYFSPEFRNRLDDVVAFSRLPHEVVEKIAGKFIEEFSSQLKAKKITLEVDDSLWKYLIKHGYDEKMGARPMARLIQDKIKNPLVDALLGGKIKKGATVRMSIEKDKKNEKVSLVY